MRKVHTTAPKKASRCTMQPVLEVKTETLGEFYSEIACRTEDLTTRISDPVLAKRGRRAYGLRKKEWKLETPRDGLFREEKRWQCTAQNHTIRR
jgi:hypothetical protein